MDTMLQTDQSSGSALTFRRATASDTAALTPLVLTSDRQEFGWLLGVPPAACETFLRRAIATPDGRFSWKRYLIATVGGQPIAALTIQDGRRNWLDDLCTVRNFLQHFGLRHTPNVIRRGLILESKIPAPARRQMPVVHYAAYPDLCGRGISRALFSHVVKQQLLPSTVRQTLVLDVPDTNHHTATLYWELGFEPMERGRRSASLPVHLVATQVWYCACN